MIAARAEYDFIDVDAAVAVDGRIMPARDVAGDGSWRELHGEDPAFLMEAALERQYVAEPGLFRPAGGVSQFSALRSRYMPTMAAPRGREIWAARLQGVAEGVAELRPICSTTNVVPHIGVGNKTGVARDWMGSRLPQILGTEVPESSISSSPSMFTHSGDPAALAPHGVPLRADSVRRLYYDLAQLRHVTAWKSPAAWRDDDSVRAEVTAWSKTGWTGGDPGGTTVFDNECYAADSGRSGAPCLVRAEAAQGSFWVGIPGKRDNARAIYKSAVTRDYVASAVILVQFLVITQEHNIPASGMYVDTRKYVAVPVTATKGAAAWEISASAMLAAAKDALDLTGRNYYSLGMIAGDMWVTQRADVLALGGIFTLGGHTDISHLNWQWRPQ